jgi:hypothetical protein
MRRRHRDEGERVVKMTIIRTSRPARFAAVTAASGIGLSPFMLDAPVSARANTGFHRPVRLPVILSRGAMNRAMPRFVVLEGGGAQRASIPGGLRQAGRIKSA